MIDWRGARWLAVAIVVLAGALVALALGLSAAGWVVLLALIAALLLSASEVKWPWER